MVTTPQLFQLFHCKRAVKPFDVTERTRWIERPKECLIVNAVPNSKPEFSKHADSRTLPLPPPRDSTAALERRAPVPHALGSPSRLLKYSPRQRATFL